MTLSIQRKCRGGLSSLASCRWLPVADAATIAAATSQKQKPVNDIHIQQKTELLVIYTISYIHYFIFANLF